MIKSIKYSLHSISILLSGTLIGAGLAFATQVFLARVLGTNDFGVFSTALAMANLLAPLAGFGVAGYWLNVFGREGWYALRWLGGSFRFLLISTIAILLLINLWAWLGPHDSVSSWLFSILSIHIIGQTAIELTGARYQLEGRYSVLGIWHMAHHSLRFGGVILLSIIVGNVGQKALSAALIFATVAIFFFLIGVHQIAGMIRGFFELKGHGLKHIDQDYEMPKQPGALTVASFSWPFGLAGILYLIFFQSDIILIKYLIDQKTAGIYSVASVIMTAVYFFPGVVFQKFLLPIIHRWAHHDIPKLRKAYCTGIILMFSFGVLVMVVLWLLGPFMLTLLFGYSYHGAIKVLKILAIASPFRFLASCSGAFLMTRNFMRSKMRLIGVCALINVTLNILLIPSFGVVGAAVATVFAEAFLMILFQIKMKAFFLDIL